MGVVVEVVEVAVEVAAHQLLELLGLLEKKCL